jgi:superoxide dismutase
MNYVYEFKSTPNNEMLLIHGSQYEPLLVIDAWEHAYLGDHYHDHANYF